MLALFRAQEIPARKWRLIDPVPQHIVCRVCGKHGPNQYLFDTGCDCKYGSQYVHAHCWIITLRAVSERVSDCNVCWIRIANKGIYDLEMASLIKITFDFINRDTQTFGKSVLAYQTATKHTKIEDDVKINSGT